jgi:hypothetical protein
VLTADSQTRAKTLVLTLCHERRKFTGHDVAKAGGATFANVSAYVRELFNSHDPCFLGYACYPLPGSGPLLYFPVPKRVLEKAGRIQAKIARNEKK